MQFIQHTKIGLLLGLAFLNPLGAHDLEAEVKVVQIEFQVHAYFEAGVSVGNATAEVTNSEGKVVAIGRTDENGLFSFTNDLRDRLEIVVVDDTGHRETFPLSPSAIALAIKGEAAKLEHTHGEGGHSHDDGDDHDHHHDEEAEAEGKSGIVLTKPDAGGRSGKVVSGLGYVLGITGILFYILGFKRKP